MSRKNTMKTKQEDVNNVKQRNILAVSAQFRTGAGSMKDASKYDRKANKAEAKHSTQTDE